MAKTISLNSLSLVDLYAVLLPNGQYQVSAVYNLYASGQLFSTVNQDVSTMLDPTTLSSLAAAFGAVQAAVVATQV